MQRDRAADVHTGDPLKPAALAPWRHSHLIAINQEYARPDTPIPNGAEVAIMPPVQGGVNNAYETPP